MKQSEEVCNCQRIKTGRRQKTMKGDEENGRF